MVKIIICKINVSKIDKARLFKGEKGTYLDLILTETPNSTYGDDFMVVQGVEKKDREACVRGAILGNARWLKNDDSPVKKKAEDAAAAPPAPSDDVPF